MKNKIKKEYEGISISIEIEESFSGHEAKYYVDGKQVFRTSVPEDDYDELVVAQYKGPRLPEGTTALPEGAVIEYILVTFLN